MQVNNRMQTYVIESQAVGFMEKQANKEEELMRPIRLTVVRTPLSRPCCRSGIRRKGRPGQADQSRGRPGQHGRHQQGPGLRRQRRHDPGHAQLRTSKLVVTQDADGLQKGRPPAARTGWPISGRNATARTSISRAKRKRSGTTRAARNRVFRPRLGQERPGRSQGRLHLVRGADREIPGHQHRRRHEIGRGRSAGSGARHHPAQEQVGAG